MLWKRRGISKDDQPVVRDYALSRTPRHGISGLSDGNSGR